MFLIPAPLTETRLVPFYFHSDGVVEAVPPRLEESSGAASVDNVFFFKTGMKGGDKSEAKEELN